MEIAKRNESKLTFIILLILGLILVFLSLGNFYLILRGVYGKFSTSSLIPNVRDFKLLFVDQSKKIALLNSNYTRNLLPEGSTWLDDNLKTWIKFLENFKYKYEIVNDDFIETNGLQNYLMIILPGSKSLSDKQIIKIKKYLENGGTVLATSGTASYSSDGKWRGWEFFSEVFGIKFSKEIKDEKLTKVHTLRGGLPLTAGIPAGFLLKVATWDIPIAAEVLDPRSIQLSYWYDYKNENGLVREEIKKSAGIVYGNYGKGRFLWMGFEINSVVGAFDDHVFLERLLKNSLNWLCRNPISYVRDWPDDYSAAAIILPYLTDDFSSSSYLINLVKTKNIPLNFIIPQIEFKNNLNKINYLSQFGEIIPAMELVKPSLDLDTVNSMSDYKIQLKNLTDVDKQLRKISNYKIKGVYPLFSKFNNSSLEAIKEMNYDYLILDSMNGNSLPKTYFLKGKRITGIYKNNRDDFVVIANYNLTDTLHQFYTYQEDIDRILFEGGIYVFSPHSDLQLTPVNISVVKSVIDDLRKKNFWIASASEISNWNNLKSRIEVSSKKIGERRIRLTVFNSGDDSASGVEVDVDLSEKIYDVSIAPEIIGTKLPIIKKLNGGSLIRLKIENLGKHETRTYYIDFETNGNT